MYLLKNVDIVEKFQTDLVWCLINKMLSVRVRSRFTELYRYIWKHRWNFSLSSFAFTTASIEVARIRYKIKSRKRLAAALLVLQPFVKLFTHDRRCCSHSLIWLHLYWHCLATLHIKHLHVIFFVVLYDNALPLLMMQS